MRKTLITLFLALPLLASAQAERNTLTYKLEMQQTASSGHTPLWLNANRHGLSSLNSTNGYVRAALERPLRLDSVRRWGLGAGLDVAAAYNFTSTLVVQQAYAEGRWLKGVLTVGSKEWGMEMKSNRLSSGAQTLGVNARPVPQVRLALSEYYTLPFAGRWLHVKGHIAYGMFTDQGWQHSFTQRRNKYSDNVLYHSKAGYLKIGNEDRFCPWSLEMGLEMAAQFGGTVYRADNNGVMHRYEGGAGLKDFWNALVPGGADLDEDVYQNAEGNQLGSWLVRLSYDADRWRLGLYADHFFEDHSSMFLADYNGYGTGAEWNVKKDNKYLMYSLKDIMLGTEINIKYGSWLRDIVVEYIYTKYQSGPVYHDRTPSLSDHVGGIDNYYNHGLYPGWQHWGQVMGNPLYMSPIYNSDGKLEVKDNRFYAFHLGLGGEPAPNLAYRLLATYQKGFGTYRNPFTHAKENVSVMLEATYRPAARMLRGCTLTAAMGMDTAGMLGHNYGMQLTMRKTGLLKY